MAKKATLQDEIEFPCNYCCKLIKFNKDIFIKGGTVRCKACGMKVVFKPHPEYGKVKRKKVVSKKWHGSDPIMDHYDPEV